MKDTTPTDTMADALRFIAGHCISTEQFLHQAAARLEAQEEKLESYRRNKSPGESRRADSYARLMRENEALKAINAKMAEALEEYLLLMDYQEPMSTQEWVAWRRKHFENCRAALALAKGEVE